MLQSDDGSHGLSYQVLTEGDLISNRNLPKFLTFPSGKNLANELWVIVRAVEKTNYLVKKRDNSYPGDFSISFQKK